MVEVGWSRFMNRGMATVVRGSTGCRSSDFQEALLDNIFIGIKEVGGKNEDVESDAILRLRRSAICPSALLCSAFTQQINPYSQIARHAEQ